LNSVQSTYGLRLLAKPSVRFTVLVALAGLAVAFRAVQFVALTTQIQWGYDFSAYWAAARRLLDHLPLYSAAQVAGPYGPQAQYLYLYPPPLAAAVTPLSALFPADYHAAAWVWAAMGAAIVVACALALCDSEKLADRYRVLQGRGRWLLVAAAFAFPPTIGELVLGNVHLLLLGLFTVAWLGIRRDDARGELIAGIAVGVAAVIKVFPAVLLLWFLLTRRHRAAAGVAIGAVAAVVLTLPLTGVEPWTQLPAVLLNLGAPTDTTDTLAPTVWLGPVVGFGVARVLVTLAGLGLIAWAAVAKVPAAVGFAIAVTVAVLIAPALYHHYLAILLLPFALALGAGVPLRWLALAYFLMWGGQQQALGDLAFLVNRAAPTLGALTLLLALLAAAWRERRVAADQFGGVAQTVG